MTANFISQSGAIGDVISVLADRTMAESIKLGAIPVGPFATEV